MSQASSDWQPLTEATLSTDTASIRAFAAALAGTRAVDMPASGVPATFAFTVLSRPEVLGPLSALAQARGAALVHQAQSFSYERDLEPDTHYQVAIAWRHADESSDRLSVLAHVKDANDTLYQTLQADIVLFTPRDQDKTDD